MDEEREDIEAEEQSVITDASAEDAALKNDGVVIPGAGQVEISEFSDGAAFTEQTVEPLSVSIIISR